MSANETITFGKLLFEEMTTRQMTARQFAEFVGVTHSTINKFLNHGINNKYGGKPVGDPSVEFLNKLSNACGIDICTLITIVVGGNTRRNTQAMLLAERIAQLPPESQEIIDNFLLGAAIKGIK